MLVFGTALPDVQEFIYKIKAVNRGHFIVPPTYGESMYDKSVKARSLGGKISVE